MRWTIPTLAAIALSMLAVNPAGAGDVPPRKVDFNRDVRPILSNACVSCHGPDASKEGRLAKPLRI